MSSRVGDTTPFGYWAFAISCFTNGVACAGWFSEVDAIFFPSMVFLGGVGQVIVGTLEALRGTPNTSSIFLFFGFYWIIEGCWAWPGLMGYYDPVYYTEADPAGSGLTRLRAMNKLMWNMCVLPILIGSFKLSIAHATCVSFIQIVNLAAFAYLITVDPDIKKVWLRVLGYCLIILALCAYYVGFHIYLKIGGAYDVPMGWFDHPKKNDDEEEVDHVV